MAYRSDSIAAVMKRLNSQYFLPAIQREFVWKPDQIMQLFDSIMRGYPISSFLFWELNPENRDKWEAYKFIENGASGCTHNELANVDGVNELTLVLDGQQRLTSLEIALKGSYTIKKKHKRRGNPDAWVKQKFYLNLLKDPKENEEDGEAGIRYGFEFSEHQPANSDNAYWIKVGKILDFDNDDRFDDFKIAEEEKLPPNTTKGQIAVFKKNLDRLHRAVWKDEVIAYYVERDQDYDRVLDIFVRANDGGTKLSKSDLLLSMVTSKWGGMNAREEINNFVDRINNDLTRKNDFDKDFVMKSCLVLTDLPVTYKVHNFNISNLSLIRNNWDAIKSAMERGVDLTNFFGIDQENLTSVNALIPIIYYFFKRPKITLRGSTPVDVKNAQGIRRWLGMALLNGILSGASDNMLRDIREVLKNNSTNPDFPVDDINKMVAKRGRTAHFDSYSIDNILSFTYGLKRTFLALSLLYDECGWGTMTYHQDHIFPQDLFKMKKLESAGFSREKIISYTGLRDQIGNLQLLLSDENPKKTNMPFEEWITTRDTNFKRRHLIPDNPDLYKFENFDKFVIEREKLIKHRLEQFFGPVEQ